ncbi:Clp protease N-terminal domain-containing protein [Subtercola endophyticus]|nr:Clp protease N-terminal domain-containing protein [Subtercola endophyticus]
MRGLVSDAVFEAAKRGSSTIEAEHVLLAIVADAGSPAASILAAGGLDHAGLSEALDVERRLSLAAIGASVPDPGLVRSTPRVSKPGWGASVAAARARAGALPRTRRAAEPALAAGILAASLGTVPRAVAYAGIDRERLLELLDARPKN